MKKRCTHYPFHRETIITGIQRGGESIFPNVKPKIRCKIEIEKINGNLFRFNFTVINPFNYIVSFVSFIGKLPANQDFTVTNTSPNVNIDNNSYNSINKFIISPRSQVTNFIDFTVLTENIIAFTFLVIAERFFRRCFKSLIYKPNIT